MSGSREGVNRTVGVSAKEWPNAHAVGGQAKLAGACMAIGPLRWVFGR